MTPKFVVILDPITFKTDSFRYDEPGQVPPIVKPEEPEEAKDGGVSGLVEAHMKEDSNKKQRPS